MALRSSSPCLSCRVLRTAMRALLVFVLWLMGATCVVARDQRETSHPGRPPRQLVAGAGVTYRQSPYKGHDDQVPPLPMIGCFGERLRIAGPLIS